MQASPSSVPLLLIIFNRPDLVGKLMERLREIRPQKLFIAADGPRPDRPGEALACQETRAETLSIDWPCEVHRLESDENQGCKLGASRAITWFFEHVEEGIILEDDCIPDPSFFRFCGELLERYRHEPRVAIISGNNFQKDRCNHSYYFSVYPHIWGWASWRRVWNQYDLEMSGWSGNPDSLKRAIPNARARRNFAKKLNLVKSGVKNSWAYPLSHLCLSRNLFSINPDHNLVDNIGFDERATHTTETNAESKLPAATPMSFPLSHPNGIEIDRRADQFIETHINGIPRNLAHSLFRSAEKRLNRIRNR